MSSDVTEAIRRVEQAEINALAAERREIMDRYGPCWNTEELQRDFTVLGFAAPYVVVIRRGDGQKGTLKFQHQPRFYFDFQADAG